MHQGWAHAISRDGGAHWTALPHAALPAPGMDGSITVLEGEGPVMLYDCISTATCKPPAAAPAAPAAPGLGDPPIIGVARPSNLSDPTLSNWTIDARSPIVVHDKSNKSVTVGFAGPSLLWTTPAAPGSNGSNLTNMVMWFNSGTALFQTTDPTLHSWTLANPAFYPKHGGGGALFYPLPGAGGGEGGLVDQPAASTTTAASAAAAAAAAAASAATPLSPTHMLQTDLAGYGDGIPAFIIGSYNASNGSFTPTADTPPSFLDGSGMSFIEIGYKSNAAADGAAYSRGASAAQPQPPAPLPPQPPRRLVYVGWVSIGRVVSVVREIFFDPVQQRLRSLPVQDLERLRSATPLAASKHTAVAPGETYTVVASGASVADVELVIDVFGNSSNSSSKSSKGRASDGSGGQDALGNNADGSSIGSKVPPSASSGSSGSSALAASAASASSSAVSSFSIGVLGGAHNDKGS